MGRVNVIWNDELGETSSPDMMVAAIRAEVRAPVMNWPSTAPLSWMPDWSIAFWEIFTP